MDATVSGGCALSAVASDSWISAAPAGSQVAIDVAPNTAQTSRTGTVHVRGAVLVIMQEANLPPNLLKNGGSDLNISG
ncbi:MAG: hypothetical protein NVSMB68_01950 [Thermoanaerobaculia bacterium]